MPSTENKVSGLLDFKTYSGIRDKRMVKVLELIFLKNLPFLAS